MAHPREATVQGIASRLISVLDRYATDMETLVQTWLDLEKFAQVTREVEQIHIFCATLPQVGRQWAGLVIAHTELVHALWKGAETAGPPLGLERYMADHRH